MSHTMVTCICEAGREQENAALVRAVFEELAQTRPAGFRYAVLQLPDWRRFVHLYTNEGGRSRRAATAVGVPSVRGHGAGSP